MIQKYAVNAFSRTEGGGNPAGVVLDADFLNDEEMQQIAANLGFSETAFLLSSQKGFLKVRYFTPLEEVRLCGHATIASFGLLKHLKRINEGTYRIETGAGLLGVMVGIDKFMLELDTPVFYEQMDRESVADSLGIDVEEIMKTPSPQIVGAGLKDLIIGVRNKEILFKMNPNFRLISEISRQNDIAGYHVFCMDEEENVQMRNFAPLLGIDEESATGTASGALAVFLYRNGLLPKSQKLMWTFYQGSVLGRPSEIDILLKEENNQMKVFVGGGITDSISLV